jgi:phosphate transport system protein
MHRHFDEELTALRENLLTMGALVESMITQASRLLNRYDNQVAAKTETDEQAVNTLHTAIDDVCVRLLVLRQPAAADMRFIAAALKINGELERIGDQAINILQRAQQLEKPGEWPQIDLGPLIHTACGMVADALDAFIKKDVPLARKVLDDEKTADLLRDQAVEVLLAKAEERKHSFAHITQLILVTHHLERVADHATNIAEDVIYFVQGLDIRHHRME